MTAKWEEFKMTLADGSPDVVMGRRIATDFYVRKASSGTWGKFWALCHMPTGAIVAKPKTLSGARVIAREFELHIPARVLGIESPSEFKTEMETRPAFVSYLKVYAYGKPCRFDEYLPMYNAERTAALA